jgi:hypothetical protein
VGFDVVLGSFGGVVGRVSVVSLGYMSVVGGGFVVARFMMFGSFFVVVGGMLVMLGCLGMMMRCFLRHDVFLSLARVRNANFGLASIVGRNDCALVADR